MQLYAVEIFGSEFDITHIMQTPVKPQQTITQVPVQSPAAQQVAKSGFDDAVVRDVITERIYYTVNPTFT